MNAPPKAITVCDLEVVVMPNGEVICFGKTVGWVKELGKYLRPQRPTESPVTEDAVSGQMVGS